MGDLGQTITRHGGATMSRAIVEVEVMLEVRGGERHDVQSKIATLIGDLRVGRVTFIRNEVAAMTGVPLRLARYDVAVLNGIAPLIEVELQITGSNNQRHLKHLQVFEIASENLRHHLARVDGHQVDVRMNWDRTATVQVIQEQEFVTPAIVQVIQEQEFVTPRGPVEVKVTPAGHITVAYTIGDALSFAEFIMAIRHILADHPDREDILDGHDLLINLASTRQHPVLPRHRAVQPRRWLHVKLQVVAEGEETRCATLLMRDDNLYVHGFLNKEGRAYALLESTADSVSMLPDEYTDNWQPLDLSVQYRSMLQAENRDETVANMNNEHLGRDFAMEAVAVLSSYGCGDGGPGTGTAAEGEVGRKLAGLILMVCESARMNPVHDSIARGWSDGTGFTDGLMRTYVWNRYWGQSSRRLQEWKSTQQHERLRPHQPVKELQDIYLVLNSPPKEDEGSQQQQPAGNNDGSDRGNTSTNPADSSRDDSNNPATGDGRTAGRGRKKRRPSRKGKGSSGGGQPADSQGNKASKGSGGGPAESQGNKASNAGHGRPRVELLAMHVHDDLTTITGTTIVVFDGRRGQVIYGHKEQGGGGYHHVIGREKDKERMSELLLTGPYRSISAYGCFAIKIDIPAAPTGSSSSGGRGARDTFMWEWDCYAPHYAAQVDEPPREQFITDDNNKDRNVAKVTYAVMSNALDATVQVKLRLKRGYVPSAYGKISARIGDFQVRSVLFNRNNWSGDCFSPAPGPDDYSLLLLHLARYVVAVPCGRLLHIEVDLHIRPSANDRRPEDKERHFCVTLPFNNAFSSQQRQHHRLDDGEEEVEVSINWSPETEMATTTAPEEPRYPAKAVIHKARLRWTLDVHPTMPWMIMTQGDYYLRIRNYETGESKPAIAIKGKEVTCAKFIASKKWIMAGCSSGIIYVYGYDPVMNNPVKRIRVLQGHTKAVNSLAVHTTRPNVLSASQDGNILIWDYENKWNLLKTFYAKSPVQHVAFNPKDTNMFASAQGKTVKIWDLHSGDCKLELTGHWNKVLCLDYFSLGDKLYLITGSKDTTAMIWDCETGSCVQRLIGHTSALQTVCFHPNLLILITGSWDGSVRLWLRDFTTFRHECKLNFGLGEVYAIASLKRSTRIAIGNEKGLVEKNLEEVIRSTLNKAASHLTKNELYSSPEPASATSRQLGQIVTDTSFPIDMLSSSNPLKLRFPSIAQMVSSTLEIRNSTDYHAAFSLCSPTNNTAKYDILPSGGVVSPQSREYVCLTRVAQNQGLPKDEVVTVKSTVVDKNTTDVTDDLFTTKTGRNVYTVELAITFAASELLYKIKSASTIDVHPTEQWMVITQADEFVRIWDYRTKEVKWTIQIKGVKVSLAKFIVHDRPKNRKQWIVVGTTSGLLYVYDCDSRKELRLPRNKHSKSITSLAVHGTKPCVLSASMDGKILLWDYANDWDLVKAFDWDTQCMKQVTFNPWDADMFATAQDDTVKIWSLDHGERDLTFSGHSGQIECFDYCIGGDEPYVITGSRDNTAKIWNSKNASCVQTLEGHAGHVTIVRYHPDLSMLITGSRGGSIRLWNSTTFRLERELKFDLGYLSSVACLKGSTRIAIGYEKGLVLADISTQETTA